jgi:hypothetical protein
MIYSGVSADGYAALVVADTEIIYRCSNQNVAVISSRYFQLFGIN